jgi:hypothetical protein
MLGKMARSAPDHRSGCPRCRSQPAFHLRLSGKLEKRYCSHQFGSRRGNPATVVYAGRYHLPEEPRWLHGNR